VFAHFVWDPPHIGNLYLLAQKDMFGFWAFFKPFNGFLTMTQHLYFSITYNIIAVHITKSNFIHVYIFFNNEEGNLNVSKC